MLTKIIFLCIFLLILALPDIYIYVGKVYEAFPGDRAKRIGKIAYFVSLVLQWGGLFFLMYWFSGGEGERTLYTNLLQGLVLTLFATKIFMLPFLLLGDVYWLGERITQAFSGTAELPERVASRRSFIKQLAVVAAGLPFVSFLHGVTRGKYNFTVHNVKIAFDDLPFAFDGFRLVQFSDFHAGSFDNPERVAAGLELLQAQAADLILFTGDLVNSHAEETAPFTKAFEVLDAPFGKYACLGNHDYGYSRRGRNGGNHQRIREAYAECGLQLLNNETVKLERDGQHLRLAGVENWGRGPYFPKKGDLDATFADVPQDDFTILMSHDPTHWDQQVRAFAKRVHLTLSGHTHGMQMGVELLGLKWSPSKWVYSRWAGLYEESGEYLYVNRGFGMLGGFPARVGIFPEITVIELVRG